MRELVPSVNTSWGIIIKGDCELSNEYIFEALKDTAKKITDLKNFQVPVILETIEEYQKAGVEEHFIEQQRLQLQKVYDRIDELEAKAERLFKRLE